MALHISYEEFIRVLDAVVPLFVVLGVAYIATKLRVVNCEAHISGINSLVASFGLPCLVFSFLAISDPFTVNRKLIAADVLCKTFLVLALGINFGFRKHGLDWFVSVFQLAAMPNLAIIGVPLLTAMYPGAENNVISLVFCQSLVWTNLSIIFYEIRDALLQTKRKTVIASDTGNTLNSSLLPSELEAGLGGEKQHTENLGLTTNIRLLRTVGSKVSKQFFLSPMTYATSLGFLYSIFNSTYNSGKPLPVILSSSLDLLGSTTLGLSMFMLGMTFAESKRLIPCGLPMALMGVFVRFFVGAAFMLLASVCVGLERQSLSFAIVQAMAPQAIISFVWAKKYNLHSDIFSTTVTLSTFLFLPVALAAYSIFDKTFTATTSNTVKPSSIFSQKSVL